MTDAHVTITATDRTDRAFNAINKNVGHVTGNLLNAKNAFAGFIGVAGVTKLGDFAKSSIEFADAIAKTADKLGISTNALQEYRFAAERSGIGTQAMDTSIQRFTRRLGEAAQGEGVLLGVLEKYNIAITDANGNTRETEDVLKDYADVIKNTTDEKERLRLAVKAFDQEGAGMVNMLRNGSAGLETLRQTARDAGVVMDEQLIRKAEVINDKWDTLTNTIGVKFKSAMISVVGSFVDTRTESEQLQSKINQLVSDMNRIARDENSDTWFDRNFGNTKSDRIKEIADEITGLATQLNILNPPQADPEIATQNKLEQLGLTDDQVQEIITRDQAVWALMQEARAIQIEEEELLEAEAAERKRMNLLELYADEEKFAQDKAARIAKIQQEEIRQQIARGESAFSTMLGNVAAHNKTFFKIQKLYRLSKLAMEAPAAIADSYAWGASWGGPPAGAAMAGIAAAAMATYAAQLAGASYGSAGSGTGASAPSTSPVISDVQPGQTTSFPDQPATQPPGGTSQIITLNLGDPDRLLSVSAARKLIEELEEARADMGPNTRVVIN